MHIEEYIVILAFGFTLGAVAFALAFGLGGIGAVGKELIRFFWKYEKEIISFNYLEKRNFKTGN